MRRVLGWLGLIVAALLGAAVTLGILYLFAPAAPYFWLLILLPLLVGVVVAMLASRLFAERAGLAGGTAAALTGVLAILPLGGLVTAMLLSPE